MTEQQYEENPLLIAQTGRLHGKKWMLESAELLIGRAPECDVVVADRQVSRRHARVLRRLEGFYIEDLGSKNGTHLNGELLQESTLLNDGDCIQIALVLELTFVGSEATMPLSGSDASQLGLGRLRLDVASHRVWLRGEELEPSLSPPQFRLLQLLYENPGQVIARDMVIRTVWPESEEAGVSEQAIDALMRRLRDRLQSVDDTHQYLVTVRGHGFRLDNPV